MVNKSVKLFDEAFLGHKIVAPEEHKRMIELLSILFASSQDSFRRKVEEDFKQKVFTAELAVTGYAVTKGWNKEQLNDIQDILNKIIDLGNVRRFKLFEEGNEPS